MHANGTFQIPYSRRSTVTSMDKVDDGEPWASQVYVPAMLRSRDVKRMSLESMLVEDT